MTSPGGSNLILSGTEDVLDDARKKWVENHGLEHRPARHMGKENTIHYANDKNKYGKSTTSRLLIDT